MKLIMRVMHWPVSAIFSMLTLLMDYIISSVEMPFNVMKHILFVMKHKGSIEWSVERLCECVVDKNRY